MIHYKFTIMHNLKSLLPLILCLIIGLNSRAQSTHTITGIVKDQKGETLPGAIVFLTNTQYKTATNNSGRFTIADIESGTYQLVVKMMGFEAYASQVVVDDKLQPLTVTLKENSVLLNTVTINGKASNIMIVRWDDADKRKYFTQFTKYFIRYFIGESTNAGQCKL